MKKIKLIAGIFWAFLGLIIIIMLFPGLNSLSLSVSRLPFMKLNPRYSGGEVVRQLKSESCTLDVRKPVFNGFLKESKSGFVQLDWHGTMPEVTNDSIDFDNDGFNDFCISIDRKAEKTILDPINKNVTKVLISTHTSYGWAVRIGLKNKKMQ